MAERVTSMRLLGVAISFYLSMEIHLDQVLASCVCIFGICSETPPELGTPASPTAPGREGDYSGFVDVRGSIMVRIMSGKDRARVDLYVHVHVHVG